MGMKPEDIPQAMVPFGRLKAAEKIEGTGLGLPLAKELVELHDGILSLSSMPGRGTRVAIHLPPHRLRPFEAEAAEVETRRAPCGPPDHPRDRRDRPVAVTQSAPP